MRVSEMTGTPWHVERVHRQDGDDRRHRSRCKFYRKTKAYCVHYSEKCRGSAHCEYYEEEVRDEEQKQSQIAPEKSVNKDKAINEVKVNIDDYPIGCRVRHKSFGLGNVRYIDTVQISIIFDNIGEKVLDLNVCVNNKLITREV